MEDDPEKRCGLRGGRGVGGGDAATSGPGTCVVEITADSTRVSDERLASLRGRLTRAIRAAGGTGEVRVRLVGDSDMSAAHSRYSGIEGTTDVLTFDMREDGAQSAGTPLDVDLWVCVDEAERQGMAREIDPDRELLLYCLHGVLHCLGYDDHDEEGYRRMHNEEDRILEAIGVGRTFWVNGAHERTEMPAGGAGG